MTYLLIFLASGLVVVLAGIQLARSADVIAERSQLGRLWIGSLLLAGATSLPELATDVWAINLGAIDLAVGDLFGSSMANMLILALIDLLPPRRQVLRQAAFDNALVACLAICLSGVAAVLVLLHPEGSFLRMGAGSLVLFVAYLAGIRAIRQQALGAAADPPSAASRHGQLPSLRRALATFTAAALVVLAAAPAFAWSAKGIAAVSGLGNTFVGTWLVGFATSLPELAACIAAVRIGSFDLAVGNLFGSCAFNMAIFGILDVSQPGNLFANLDPSHALSAIMAIVLMSLGLAAIVYRARRRFVMLEPDSLLMVLVYVLAIIALYRHEVG